MTLLVTLLIALVVLVLCLYAIDLIPLGDVRIKRLIQAVVVLLAALWVAQRAGVFYMDAQRPTGFRLDARSVWPASGFGPTAPAT